MPPSSLIRLAAAIGIAATMSACTTAPKPQKYYDEVMVRAQIHGADTAPAWVTGLIQSDPERLSFVGRGLALNVLDERKAYDEAIMHAREQLAQYIRTRVISEACDEDWADGARYIPSSDLGVGATAASDAQLSFRAGQVADAVVGELLPTAQHWEQWELEDASEPHKVTRYKCWVLAEVPADRVSRMIEATLGVLENEARAAMAEHAAAAPAGPSLESVELAAALAREAELAGMVNANLEELMSLRERVMYGRAFRLSTKDNCPTPVPCQPLARPDWRSAQVEVSARVETVIVHEEKDDRDLTPCERLAAEGR